MNKNKSIQVYLPNGDVSTPTTNGRALFKGTEVKLKRSSSGSIYWDIIANGPNDIEVVNRIKQIDREMSKYKESVEQ